MKFRLITITEAEASVFHLARNLVESNMFREHVLEVLQEQSRRRRDDPMYASADLYLQEICRTSSLKRSLGFLN